MSSKMRVTINVAQSLNGMIAGKFGRRVQISSQEDWNRVLDLRTKSDAILIGANTVINDNPDLYTGRTDAKERLPVRVLLDGRLSIPTHSRIFDGRGRTLVFTANRERKMLNCDLVYSDDIHIPIPFVIETLESLNVRNLLVEGGSIVINEFLRAGIVDDFFLYTGNILIESDGIRLFEPAITLPGVVQSWERLGDGYVARLDVKKLMGDLVKNGRRGS
ncbi:MAG: dihydrofolate reductase family protein [Candidatus Thermoplasmatota archaeon]|nr:dihydrofolate reductase family protein [Candidatus Thermoplasmatota archaeon]